MTSASYLNSSPLSCLVLDCVTTLLSIPSSPEPKEGMRWNKEKAWVYWSVIHLGSPTQNIHTRKAHHCLYLSEGHTSQSHLTQPFRASEHHCYLAILLSKIKTAGTDPQLYPKTKESQPNISAGCHLYMSVMPCCVIFTQYMSSHQKKKKITRRVVLAKKSEITWQTPAETAR